MGALAVRVYCTSAQGPARGALGSPGHENESEWSGSPPRTALADPAWDALAPGASPLSPAPSPPTEGGGSDDHPGGETAEPVGDAAGCEEPGASRTHLTGGDREPPLPPNDAPGERNRGESSSGPSFRGTDEAWRELSSGLGRWRGELQRQARSRASANRSSAFEARRRTTGDIRAEQGRRPETTEKRTSALHKTEPVRGLWRERARRSVSAALIGMVCALLVLLVAFMRVGGHSATPGRSGRVNSQDL